MLYLRPLGDLTDNQLRKAFGNAAAQYKPFNGSFPSPAELRDFAELGRVMDDAPEIMARGLKPPDWVPMREEDRGKLEAQVHEAAKTRWVMPKPQALDYRGSTEASLAKLNGPSRIPSDPAERRAWATKRAHEMGYAGNDIREVIALDAKSFREAGDEND